MAGLLGGGAAPHFGGPSLAPSPLLWPEGLSSFAALEAHGVNSFGGACFGEGFVSPRGEGICTRSTARFGLSALAAAKTQPPSVPPTPASQTAQLTQSLQNQNEIADVLLILSGAAATPSCCRQHSWGSRGSGEKLLPQGTALDGGAGEVERGDLSVLGLPRRREKQVLSFLSTGPLDLKWRGAGGKRRMGSNLLNFISLFLASGSQSCYPFRAKPRALVYGSFK